MTTTLTMTTPGALRLTIDGRSVEVSAGATVLDGVKRLGLPLPHLCKDPDRPPLDPSSPEGIARYSVDDDLWDGLEDAKHELDAGRPICAFARSENMRSRFGDDKFNVAFTPVFRHKPGFDPRPKAEKRAGAREAAG